ncbi:uncharacterized protein L201_004250 [Kwoniella dendrophila CBS 6074]|uniref:Enoyl reductase (ER) domain-containing protein n=1 Tax=Kwoniella dendrophila CBS 6074 TaxID=1295534 RepID=A0AAX4JWR1_9TREE
MPKPTFLQAVLKKPTRSYADPYHSPPWADQVQDQDQDDSRQSYYTSNPRSRYEDEYGMAGPSRPRSSRRGPGSNLSTSNSVMSENVIGNTHSMGSRFPKPARRVVSNVTLRDGNIVEGKSNKVPKSSSSAIGLGSNTISTNRKKKEKLPRNEEGNYEFEDEDVARPASRAGMVKKKKKPKSIITKVIAEDESITSSSPTSTTSLPMPPPIRSKNSEISSSAASSPVPPISPVISTHSSQQHLMLDNAQQKPVRPNIQKSPLPLLTPPSSAMSTPNSSSHQVQTVISTKKPIAKEVQVKKAVETPKVIIGGADSDSDEDVFYTPNSSVVELSLPSPTGSEDNKTPKPSTQTIIPPSFNFLPPTPAPIPETHHSPFHSEPSSSNSSSLHPDRPFVPRILTQPGEPPESSVSQTTQELQKAGYDDEDAQSAFGEAGSDDDKVYERQGKTSRQASGTFERPKSGIFSHPSSVVGRSTPPSVDGFRPSSRQSTTNRHFSRNSSDEFPTVPSGRRPSAPVSEASFVSAPNRPESSLRGSISGYGKGGWAAANSTKSFSSRPSSPVMFMPTSGDGWSDFQQVPPPRQSRFTPLPSASFSPNFDKITDGSRLSERIGGSSARGSQYNDQYQSQSQLNNQLQTRIDYGVNGLRPPSRSGESSPSEYSQLSDGLEMPSRSYIKREDSSESKQSSNSPDNREGSENGGRNWNNEGPSPQRPPPPGSLSFPVARVGSLSLGPSSVRPPSRNGSQYTSSRPMSQYMDSSRPTSPSMYQRPPSVMSNAQTASPLTFNPPSFLNPDLLTILPQMTNEDSDRLYQSTKTPSESGKGKRNSMQDWASHNPARRSSIFRAKSEVGHEEDDGERSVPDIPARRSKSVLGFRNRDHDREIEKERERERKWEGSSYGDGVLMESHGRAAESVGGYTNLVLPSGAYRPINPAKSANGVDSRILGMPHATMASIVLSTAFSRHSSTPAHLRDNLPPLVEFSSHLKPPTKVNDSQLLIQVYAVAIDQLDVKVLEEKARWDVGKYVPGRSFVGRALVVGADEKEVVRGDLVVGINDIRKSGALSEYIIVDRRRISRAPFPTSLSLEQLSLLPLQGISAARSVRTHLIKNSRAIIINAHEGIGALICQELSRSNVNIISIINGGTDSHENHKKSLENGSKGVLVGNSPATILLSLEENSYDFIYDNVGGQRVFEAAKRLLKNGGKYITTTKPDSSHSNNDTSSSPTSPKFSSRPSGLKSLKAAFGGSSSSSSSRHNSRKDSQNKFISIEYLNPIGSNQEPEVDSSGMDYRDIMEEPCMAIFKPNLPEYISLKQSSVLYNTTYQNQDGTQDKVKSIVNFEKGHEIFKRDWEGVRVIRVIN